MASQEQQPQSFEAAMSELQTIVQNMEHGELSLEDSLKAFERGVQLVASSQAKLQSAEQKVQILMQQQGQQNGELAPFEEGGQ